ncbi:SusE domain-containing protein [Proteiniphilum saccharofermentans]|uniref:SusE domain-containing protein n=1 Tax=Proteiniphilum saccharofermentans TaxID=1642647 RepID=UPI0028AD7A18|nr:SusE domain-containing protein [Proteiniphilum saccharofermentans]
MMYKSDIMIALITLLAALFASCSDNMGTPDDRLVAVTSLIEPMDAREVVLEPSVSAALYFEWDYVNPGEAGVATYRIAFDNADGDFSSPIYIITADNNGLANHVTVSHRDLNKIAGKAGINPSATGTIKWTVLSSKGTKTMKSSQEYNLVITRLAGFEDIPMELFITGEATEGGADIANAIAMKNLAEGEFEIYTRLTAGQPFKFVSGKSGEFTTYSLTDDNIVIDGSSEVPLTGVYKFYLNFEIGSYTTKHISKVSLFLNWSQLYIELPYIGSGVWGVTDYEISGLSGNDNTDDRYKFRMESSEGETEWRAADNDSKPTGAPEYYYMVERTNVTQWTDGQIWKSPASDGWSGKRYDITFSLNPDGPYTHNLVIK